jgi:hypothetical protein
MKSLKSSFTAFIAIIILSCSYYACSSSSSDIKNETDVPLHVLQEANLFIVSKTGAEFFHNYIAVDNVKTKHSPPYYEMVYNLYIPEKPYVNTSITFLNRKTLSEYQIAIKIPYCVIGRSIVMAQYE